MTKSTSGEREKRATEAPASPRSDEPDLRSDETPRTGANIPYIDPPTIPAGMTVETYRHVRERRKPHRVRRLASPALWLV
jgi:hypothetical protein